MATVIRKRTAHKKIVRFKRKKRIRSVLEGTTERPRLSVFRSNKNLYVQIIDDQKGHTLVAASTQEEAVKNQIQGSASSIAAAEILGGAVAAKAKAQKIERVVFDRSGYLYHGKIKALAEAARKGGLQF